MADIELKCTFSPLENLNQLVYCKDCKYRRDAHYESKGEHPYIKSVCENKAGLKKGYRVNPYDFCSRGKLGSYDEESEDRWYTYNE